MDSNNRVPKHGIEDLEKKLYNRDSGDFKVRRSNLDPYYRDVNKTWAEETPEPVIAKSNGNVWVKVLGLSFLFFLLAIVSAWYIFFFEKNVVSDKNIEITVDGPVSLKAGDELSLQITLTNKNTVAISDAEFTTVWPSGTRDSADISKQITYTDQKIGQINSGETVNILAKAIVYGKENDELEIKFNLSYHLIGSNTIFEKEATYRFKINASPIELEALVPSEINSNQESVLNLKVKTNSDKPLNNVLVEVIYPPGFQFKQSNVPPTYESRKWLLGDLQPGVERVINITGVIEGQSEELKSFRVLAGIKDPIKEQTIAVLYNDSFKTTTIKKSFLGLSLIELSNQQETLLPLNNEKNGYYAINWVNNLSVKIKDVKVVARLRGEALNKRSVSSLGGYYSSLDNTITWDKNTTKELASVEPGAAGQLSFNFSSISLLDAGKDLRNPEIYIDVTITGTRVSEGFSNEKIQTDLARVVKINSAVVFDAKTFYRDGPLTNSGPLPPKVDNPTTYTLTWSLLNSSNDLRNSVIETSLPLGVEWVGATSPANENVSYNNQNRKVTWDLGFIKAGTGLALPRRTASFQVSFTPSIDQLGNSAKLTGSVIFRGVDTFTKDNLISEINSMSNLLNDAGTSKNNFIITR